MDLSVSLKAFKFTYSIALVNFELTKGTCYLMESLYTPSESEMAASWDYDV